MKRLVQLILAMVLVLGAAQAQAAQFDTIDTSTSPLIMSIYHEDGSSSTGNEVGIAITNLLSLPNSSSFSFTWNSSSIDVLTSTGASSWDQLNLAVYGAYKKSNSTGALTGYYYVFSSTNSDLTSIRSGMYTSYGAAVSAVDGYYNDLDTDNDGIVTNSDASHANSYDTRLNGNSGAAGQMYGFLGTDLSGEANLATIAEGGSVTMYLYALETFTNSGRDSTPEKIGSITYYADGTAVYTPTPAPAAVVLLLSGCGVLSLAGRRFRSLSA